LRRLFQTNPREVEAQENSPGVSALEPVPDEPS